MDNSNNDITQLPDAAVLRQMAKDNPKGLEALRLELANAIIQQAPLANRPKLRQLQADIDRTRKGSKDSMQACINISQMMIESLANLQHAMCKLNEASGVYIETCAREISTQQHSQLHFDKRLLLDEPEADAPHEDLTAQIKYADFSVNTHKKCQRNRTDKTQSAKIMPFPRQRIVNKPSK